MLVTSASNRRNRTRALAFALAAMLGIAIAGCVFPLLFLALILCPLVYWLVRRRTLRRLWIASGPFPADWDKILQTHVAFYRALSDSDKKRFQQIVQVFLDEVRITGIRTEVDDTVRVLVAASAAIPIFGFHDWEYHGLGEVLVYPMSFGEGYRTTGGEGENTLGMVGLKHLSGVMILSKPSLFEGFDNSTSQGNVGVHEFVHLVEQEEAEHGLPSEVPWAAARHWVQYVARELSQPRERGINAYAYTNEHEFLAVLSEYFFKSPHLLAQKDPELYALLKEMFHQDTRSLLPRSSPPRRLYGRNDPCPCGSGKKYKNCCLSR